MHRLGGKKYFYTVAKFLGNGIFLHSPNFHRYWRGKSINQKKQKTKTKEEKFDKTKKLYYNNFRKKERKLTNSKRKKILDSLLLSGN